MKRNVVYKGFKGSSLTAGANTSRAARPVKLKPMLRGGKRK